MLLGVLCFLKTRDQISHRQPAGAVWLFALVCLRSSNTLKATEALTVKLLLTLPVVCLSLCPCVCVLFSCFWKSNNNPVGVGVLLCVYVTVSECELADGP